MLLGMGSLTEREIIDCLSENFRLAAENAGKLAVSPKRGLIYRAFRDQLKLLEGAARQLAYWRGGDARWLQVGLYMAECHKRAGDWLRGVKQPSGGYRPLSEGQKHPLFMKLADNLRAAQVSAERLRDMRTNRIGPILPKPGRSAHRDTVPVGWRKSGALLVPASI